IVRDVPAFGYAVHNPLGNQVRSPAPTTIVEDDLFIVMSRRGLRVGIDKTTGLITEFTSPAFPNGLANRERPWGHLEATFDGQMDPFEQAVISVNSTSVKVSRFARNNAQVDIQ